MSDVILGALIAGLPSILALLIRELFELPKKKSEEVRWYAEFFFTRGPEAIHKLFLTLVDSYVRLQQRKNTCTSEVFEQEIRPRFEAVELAAESTSIFLTDAEKHAMKEIVNAVKVASSDMHAKLATRGGLGQKFSDDAWDQLDRAHQKATDCLKNILNPKGLREWLEKFPE